MFDPRLDFVLSLTNVYEGGVKDYMIRDVEHETMPREDLETLQLKRLQAVVERVYHLVPFYRRRMDELGVKPEHIRTLEDIRLLPFTTKQDLRDNYPFGMFAAPMDQVVRIHASSGTTGKPTPVGYTQRDLETWSELIARALAAAGVHRGDIIHVAYGYGLFTGGLGLHYGAERLGAAVIPVSGGQTRRQIMLIQDFGPTVICCTPSFALYLAEVGQEMGVDFAKTKLRVGIFGAEPWTEGMRQETEKRLSLDAIDIYGLSEVMGPGVAIECLEAKQGLHIFEDHFLPEIINPATLEAAPVGDLGELVITTLTKEAFPLLRYRTRDITSLNYAPCKCGRTMARINRFQGRSDDMLIIRGVNVFPSQIESVLMETPGVAPHYQLIVDRDGMLDTLEVQVEVDEATFSDEVKQMQSLAQSIQRQIKDYFTVSVKVKLVEPRTIPRSEGKAKRVIDNRKL
jgi:phenylacetate-CoA ligase